MFDPRIRLTSALLILSGLTACGDPADRDEAIREDGVPIEAFTSWSHYLGDPGRSHYSALTGIDTTNVSRLEVVWSYESGGLEEGARTEIQHNPLIVGDALYGTNPRLELFRLDARTGEETWRIDLPDADMPSWFGRSRGLMRWVSEDGGDERIYFAGGPYLYAADARTGRLVPSFATDGKVDLREGLGRDPERLLVGMNTPGAVFEDLLIVGMRANEGEGAAPGHIRAYDARTGEIVWTCAS